MDEIDAALDFRNVSIVASYIKERTKNGQFIIISLRNNMFELADRLVGIYKVKITKTIIILYFSRRIILQRVLLLILRRLVWPDNPNLLSFCS